MTKLSVGISVLLLASGTAFAAGVNDAMPNGQQGYVQAPQRLNPNVTPATPNQSGAYYSQPRVLYPQPRVRGSRVRVYR